MVMRIGFIGLGKLGGPCSDTFQENGYDVNTYDVNGGGNKQSIKDCVTDAEILFIAVPTPHDPKYDGRYVCSHLEPKDFDYTILKGVVEEANEHMDKSQMLVVISTVLPGTIRKHIKPLVTNTNLVYNPYLIAMGTVKRDFLNPEMIMIGSDNDDMSNKLKDVYSSFCECDRYILGTWEECESIKIFYNTFITTKITLCNMIQDVSMKLGNMNVDVVTEALGNSTDRIMSNKYMRAGLGDGGSCHPRDNIALRFLAEDLDLGYDIFDTIIRAREVQAKNMADFLTDLSEKHNLPIVIIGKGFKPGLEYEDGSPSILISQFCECTFDDLSEPALFLFAHSKKTTFNGVNDEYDLPEGSVTVDPWREREADYYYGK
jgi:UDPglucose 6-dehydrogenase